MKRFILIVIVLIIGINIVYGKSTDVSLAISVAKNFYNQNSLTEGKDFVLAYTEKTSIGDTAIYFIFNVGQNDGWVIVSADDATLPILGHSQTGHFNNVNLSPEFSFWMSSYKNQILYLKRNNILATDDIKRKWQNYVGNKLEKTQGVTKIIVGPLLTTKWGQWAYYNDLCPNGTPTGCTATAMAQIMKFWNSPVIGTGSHQYNSAYGIQSANFGATNYEWNIPNSVTSPNNAVATLMYHCGVSVEMDYGPQSGAAILTNDIHGNHPNSAEHAYPTYFGYNSSTIQGLERDKYQDSYWINNILKPELDNGRPIQYGGTDVPNNAMHTWVCEGYNDNDEFYMNWGWDGDQNGWFTIYKLNLEPYNLVTNQAAIVGIKPNSACYDPREPNDKSSTASPVFASPLNNGSSDLTWDGNIGWAGDQDWFKIDIGYPGTLTINLSNLPFDYDLELYGPTGLTQWIARSDHMGTNSEQIIYPFTGSSTTVFAKVYPKNANNYTTSTCYKIQFVWAPRTGDLPDLILSSLEVTPTTLNQGATINLKSVVNNSGPGNAGISHSAYYISNGSVIDGTSYLLGTSSVGALVSGGSSSQNESLTIPANTVPGLHYILFVADYQKEVNESNEVNNTQFLPITISSTTTDLPNLIPDQGSIGTNGNRAIYQYSVRNIGNANAGSFYINCYVCTTSTFTNPIWVAEDFVSGGLPINSAYGSQRNVDLCYLGLPSGSYYFGYYIDRLGQVNESNKNDNNLFESFNSLPINCSVNCQYSIAPNNSNFLFGGGSNWSYLICSNSCSWTANSPESWITVQNTSGMGSSYIHYEVSTNPLPNSRTGYIVIAGLLYTVTQNGKNCPSDVYPKCDYISKESGDYSFKYSVGTGCGYGTYISDLSWINITSVQGDTMLYYHVDENLGMPRSGSITIDTAQHYIIQSSTTSVIDPNFIPKNYVISQNFPNPFNPSTVINYGLPQDGMVSIIIFDLLGREVRTLVNERKRAGTYSVEFNAGGLSSGTYLYRLTSGNYTQNRKLILLK